MVKNPKFLKKLLTTASALAVTLSATTSFAADYITTIGGGKSDLSVGTRIKNAAGAGPNVPAPGSTIFLANDIDMDAAINNLTFNIYGYNGSTMAVDATTKKFTLVNKIGAAEQAAAAAANGGVAAVGVGGVNAKVILALAGDYNYDLDQATSDLIGTIDLTTRAATIKTNNLEIKGNVLATGGAPTSKFIIDATDVKFTGAFAAVGGTAVQGITVNDGKNVIFNTDLILTQDLILGSAGAGGAKAKVLAGKDVTLREIKGDAAGKGDLKFEGASTVIGTVGTAAKLNSIELGNGKVEFQGNGGAFDIKAAKIILNAGSILKTSTQAATIEGIISTTVNKDGIIEIDSKTKLTGAGTAVGTKDNRLKAIHFASAKQLDVDDGVNIFLINEGNTVDTGITATAAGDGHLKFEGDSTVDAVFTTRAIGKITSANANKTVTFTKNVNVARGLTHDGIITIGNTSTMKFGGDVAAEKIIGVGAGQGTAVFNSDAPATITMKDGTGNKVLAMKVLGKDLKFADKFLKADTIDFGDQAANIIITSVGDYDLTTGSLTNITTTSTTRNQNFTITDGNLTTAKAGTKDKHFGTFAITGPASAGKLITVSEADFYASIAGKDVNAAFIAVDGKVDNIGTVDAIMDVITFNESTAVSGNAYAKQLSIGNNKVVSFADIVSGGKVMLGAGTSTATFKDGSSLFSNVVVTNDGEGIANFEGASEIKNGLGKASGNLAQINFTDNDNKLQSLGGDFYAEDITFLKTVARADNKVIFHGTVDLTDTTLDLGTKGITFKDGDKAHPSQIKGNITLKTEFNGSTNGVLTVSGADTILDFTNTKNINVVLLDTTKDRGTTRTVYLLNGEDSATSDNFKNLFKVPSNGSVDPLSNKLVEWTYDAGLARFTSKDISAQVSENILKARNGSAEAIANMKDLSAAEGGDAKAYADELFKLINTDETKYAESLNRFSSPIAVNSSKAVEEISRDASDIIGSRIETVASPDYLRVTAADGISAGAEDTLRYGVWGSPFYGQGVQKMRKGVSGYKTKSVGGTIGFDTMANDTMVVGLAATVAKTDIKHKNTNAGDKTKADTLMISIYGVQQISNDWFLQGIANFGSTKVKNTSKRFGILNNAITSENATAKYDTMSWGGEVLGGYNVSMSSFGVVTPMLGLRYTRINDGGYTETGTRNQNQIVSKNSTDKLQAVAGIRAVMANIEQSGFVITPEVHGFVRQELTNKKAKLDVKLSGLNKRLDIKNAKPAKTSGNLGLGVNASSGMMSYGLIYDANLAHKYIGHQGTFKIRVNF